MNKQDKRRKLRQMVRGEKGKVTMRVRSGGVRSNFNEEREEKIWKLSDKNGDIKRVADRRIIDEVCCF